jgi:hypothetical protein
MATKADISRKHRLTPQQESAVDLLAIGRTVTETAEAINVARQTVSEWLNHNAAFEAGLNSRRQQLWQINADRLRALIPKALDVLDQELDGVNRLRAAAQILRSAGFYDLSVPAGATAAEDIEIAARHRERERMFSSLLAT